MGQYLPVVTMAVLAVVFAAVSLLMSKLLAPRRSTTAKRAPYESGIIPARDNPERFPVHFYLVAMIFVVFDIEIIFLYPWAVIYRDLGVFGLVEIVVFAVAVFVSFVYLISNGALDWGPLNKARRQTPMVSAERTTRTTVRRVGLEGRADAPVEPEPRRGGARLMGWDMSQGLEGIDHNFLTGKVEDLVQWSRLEVVVAGDLRPGLLRPRDDGRRRRPLRPRPLRHGGLPGVAPPGRHHDRGRARLAEDGPGAAPDPRPDDGAQVGHLHGRVRQQRRDVQQLRAGAGRRPDRAGRRVRPRLPARPRDADPRHRDAARQHRLGRAAAPPRGVGRRRRPRDRAARRDRRARGHPAATLSARGGR